MNVASRLESSGISGRIQVSEQLAQILSKHGQFETECRGPIEVKGKGLLTTYLVVTPYDKSESNLNSMEAERSELASEEKEEEEPPMTLEATEDEVEQLGADSGGDL